MSKSPDHRRRSARFSYYPSRGGRLLLGLVSGVLLVGFALFVGVQSSRGEVEPDVPLTRGIGFVIAAAFGLLGLLMIFGFFVWFNTGIVVDAKGLRVKGPPSSLRLLWSDIQTGRIEVLRAGAVTGDPLEQGLLWLEFGLTDGESMESRQPGLKRYRIPEGDIQGCTHYLPLNPVSIAVVRLDPSDPDAYPGELLAVLENGLGDRFGGCFIRED